MDSQDFHGVDDAFLSHFNHGKLPVVEDQVVLALEVRFDADSLLFTGGLVVQLDLVLPSVAVDQALDHEVGTQHRATTVVRLNLQFLEATMNLEESGRFSRSSMAIGDGLQNTNEMLPVSTVENSHGSPHVGGASPKAGVRNIDVHNKSATLDIKVSPNQRSEKREKSHSQSQVEWPGKRP